MGAWDDYIDEMEAVLDEAHDYYRGMATRDLWVANGGQVYKISEMTDEHIENCIRMLEHFGYEHSHWPYMKVLKDESTKRGHPND